MAQLAPEEDERLARAVLADAHRRVRDGQSGGGTPPEDLWVVAGRRRARRRGFGSVAVAAVVVGLSGPLWWPNSDAVPDPVAATTPHTESVSPATSSTPAASSSPPKEQAMPTGDPNGEPSGDEEGMAGERGSMIIDAVREEPGYAGLRFESGSSAITLHWAGTPPDRVVDRARDLAAPSELIIDPTARISRADMAEVMATVTEETQEELSLMGMGPNYLTGEITVWALPESPLHDSEDPTTLMGLAGKGVEVRVLLMQPEDIPVVANEQETDPGVSP